jgi:hypothetical protein
LSFYFNKTIKAMALIGYGEADFHSMVTKGHHFVDRTSFIARQESLGNRNLLFVRPRRFGKSLWQQQIIRIRF